jgi:hypothetical protein
MFLEIRKWFLAHGCICKFAISSVARNGINALPKVVLTMLNFPTRLHTELSAKI